MKLHNTHVLRLLMVACADFVSACEYHGQQMVNLEPHLKQMKKALSVAQKFGHSELLRVTPTRDKTAE